MTPTVSPRPCAGSSKPDSEELRAEAHLRIGIALAPHTPAAKREEAIFEIVNQRRAPHHFRRRGRRPESDRGAPRQADRL
jgi:hypothetical protein